jgi:glycosyltransferase involved in cell wall biosynthesis
VADACEGPSTLSARLHDRENEDPVKVSKPKLLMASAYFPPEVGGLERYAFEMAKIALAADYDVVVISSDSGKTLRKEFADGMTIYRIPTQFKVMNTPINLRWYGMIKKIVEAEKPDLINVHMPVPYLADLVILAARGVPSIVTYHSGSMKKRNLIADRAIDLYELLILRMVLRKSTKIICSSEFVRNTFLKRYKAKSVTVSPGVDTSMFTRRTVKPEDGKIIFIGNFSYGWKGLRYLREAVRLLPSASLVVVGTGTHEESERTTYLGSLRGDELVREIHSSRVLVLPSVSNSEAFGMVLIEAMACGVPVVGSAIGGIPCTIIDGEDGLLAAPRSAPSLASAIKLIFDTPELEERLIENAYRKVLESYTWEAQGQKYIRVLEEVCEASPAQAQQGLR